MRGPVIQAGTKRRHHSLTVGGLLTRLAEILECEGTRHADENDSQFERELTEQRPVSLYVTTEP
jgi:hypothetical protein